MKERVKNQQNRTPPFHGPPSFLNQYNRKKENTL
jgi:hypothetical protein